MATTDAMIAGVRVVVIVYDTPDNVIELLVYSISRNLKYIAFTIGQSHPCSKLQSEIHKFGQH